MLAVYQKDARACDEMTEAEFAGYWQNISFVLKQQGAGVGAIIAEIFAAMRPG